MDKTDYKNLATRIINDNKGKVTTFDNYQKMWHLEYNLPDQLKDVDWIRKYVSPDPHDAISAGDRVLSSLWPRIDKRPLAPGERNKARSNEEERVIDWHLRNMNLLRSRSFVSDMARSALLYDCIAVYLGDLEDEIKYAKAHGSKNLDNLQYARKSSRFYTNVYYPGSVHVRTSRYGTDVILLTLLKPKYEIRDEYGDVFDNNKTFDNDSENVHYYELMTRTERMAFVSPGEDTSEPLWLIDPEEHGRDFWAWVTLMGGSDIEYDVRHKHHPMLYPINQGKNWDTHNIIKTLEISESIARSGSPRFVEEGVNRASAVVNYFNPARIAKAPPGNTLRELRPPDIDRALTEFDDRISADIQKATVSRLLQGGDIPSGTAYATLNLATQTAIGSLKPAKQITEAAIANMCRIILLWSKHTGIPLMGYEISGRNMGAQYSIEPEQIDPEGIYIDVELTPDIPSDQLRRANTAQMLIQLGYPRARALQDVGVTDPERAIWESYFDEYVRYLWTRRMKMQDMQDQLQLQGAMADVQQQVQQQAQRQMQGAPPGTMPEMAPPGRGQGWNPAVQGQSPGEMLSEEQYIREMVRGEDITGAGAMPPEI